MAEEVEVSTAPEVETEPSAQRDNGPIVFDESLLIKVKGKVKRPNKPDENERNIPVGKLQAEIQKHSDRIKEIKEIIESRRSSSRNVGSGSGEIVKRLQVLRNEFQTVLVRVELRRWCASVH